MWTQAATEHRTKKADNRKGAVLAGGIEWKKVRGKKNVCENFMQMAQIFGKKTV